MKQIFVILLILFAIVIPVSASTAQLQWSKTIGYCVTALDTDYGGNLIFAGLGNGSIFVYNDTGDLQWANSTNTSSASRAIKKIVSDTSGNIVWINAANQSGSISSTGTVSGVSSGSGRNITDVAISSDGFYYVTTELNPPRIAVRFANSSIAAQNTTFGIANWTKVGYDPGNQWLVTANQSDDTLYFWNISSWNGWEVFNPYHSGSKNVSQIQVDRFPYSKNLNITGLTNKSSLTFYNTTNTTFIQKINNSYFEYNRINTGKYFWWTPAGTLLNMSNVTQANQTYMLGMSNVSGEYYRVVLQNWTGNFTLYYGDPTYTFDYGAWTLNGTNVTLNYTAGTYSWTAPVSTLNISTYMIGSGGHGGNGNELGGTGGGAGTATSAYLVPGTTYSITVGYTGSSYSAGQASSVGAYSGAGGTLGTIGGMGGNTGGAGGSGYTDYSPYPNGSSGTIGYPPTDYGAGGAGGSGYGAGGGGGGTLNGYGGNGAAGVVRITYIVIEKYPVLSELSTASSSRYSGLSLNQSSSREYVGTILGISVPSYGGVASISSDTIFYQQYLSATGFGAQYNGTLPSGGPALYAGTPADVKASNSGVASIEGRGSYALVYDSSGVVKATSLTAGDIRSVDTAMQAGSLAAFGGIDGKLYMVSREGSSSWYSYYTGTADTRVDAVAVSWDALYVAVGRFGGTLEFYNTSINSTASVVPTPAYVDATVRVYKDAAPYSGQNITVYSSPEGTGYSQVDTGFTDDTGSYNYMNTIAGQYYKFVVNSGEGEVIWQSNTMSTIVTINIAGVELPYSWDATYNQTSNNVTVVYTDSTPATNVTVVVKDLANGTVIGTSSYYGTTGFVYSCHNANTDGKGTFQVTLIDDRAGSTIRDQRTLTSSSTYGIPLSLDKNIVYFLATLILMVIAGLFTAINARRGGFAVVVIAVVFMVWDFLPWSIVTTVMIAALFAVLSLFASGSKKGE